MKTRDLLVILVLCSWILTACQSAPIPPTLTATTVPSTNTPLPTNTPTPTSTATPAPTPTATIEMILLPKNGDIIPHELPGIIPNGMPDSAVSEFFSSSAGFNIDLQEMKLNYVLTLDKKKLPDGATLIVHFENPLDQSTAIVGTVDDPSLNSIMVMSVPLTGFKCRNYWIDVHVYSDSSMTNEVGVHLQWDRSSFDLDKITSPLDFLSGSNCK